MKSLFIESIFEAIGQKCKNNNFDVEVIPEAYAEGKRIDLLIVNNDWVIGIENKTGASVYNPLGIYKKRIEGYGKKDNYKILLTLYEITKEEELENINKNGFKIVLYMDYFNILKSRLDRYNSDNNQKYKVFLYDFMQTLEDRKGGIVMSKELNAFFFNNSECIDGFCDLYKEFKKPRDKKKYDKFIEIRDKIKEKSKGEKWETYESLELNFFKDNKEEFGISTCFNEKINDPIAVFEISFRAWKKQAWDQYGEKIMKIYPKGKYNEPDKYNTFLHVYKISGKNDDEIIDKLLECYKVIMKLK
jgi:hypothetical protein